MKNTLPITTCQILQTSAGENALVAFQDDRELFRISFPESIIRKFYEVEKGYVIIFQCRSLISKKNGNVCMISKGGQILWWAERRNSQDCYVEFDIREDRLVGYDGSFNCWINMQNGKIERQEFVK